MSHEEGTPIARGVVRERWHQHLITMRQSNLLVDAHPILHVVVMLLALLQKQRVVVFVVRHPSEIGVLKWSRVNQLD